MSILTDNILAEVAKSKFLFSENGQITTIRPMMRNRASIPRYLKTMSIIEVTGPATIMAMHDGTLHSSIGGAGGAAANLALTVYY